MTAQPTDLRLTDVISDGIEAVRSVLGETGVAPVTMTLPEPRSVWQSNTPWTLSKYLKAWQALYGWAPTGPHARVVQWFIDTDQAWVGQPRYTTPEGHPTSAKASYGTADGSLMVEIGRTPGWKVERAFERGFSLLLVPINGVSGMLISPQRDTLAPPVVQPEIGGTDSFLTRAMLQMVHLDESLNPEVRLWHEPAAKLQAMHDFCLGAGVEHIARRGYALEVELA